MDLTTLFIRRPGHDDARHDRDPGLRHRGLPAAAGERPAERGLPDDHRDGDAARAPAPQTMAATVATPLEKEFSTIAGIDNMTSTSSLGQSQIVVQFALDRNIDAAAQDVQAAIAQTLRQLPQGHHPAVVPEDQPGRRADPDARADVARRCRSRRSTSTARRRSRSASRWSAAWPRCSCTARRSTPCACRWIPAQLASRGIALEDVLTAVTNQNVNLPTGVLWGPKTALTIQASGQLDSAGAFKDIIVAYRNGAPVHLSELGRITDDVQNNKTASWYNGEPAIVLAIQRQPGTNTVDVVEPREGRAGASSRAEIPPTVNVRRALRPLGDDRSVGARRDVHARADARARGRRDLPVPAQLLRDGHPEPGAADVDHRHVLGDVPAALQPRQPLADGADARRRASWWTTRSSCSRTSCGIWRWERRRCRPRSTARRRSASRSSR